MKNLYSALGIVLAASLSIISCTKDPIAPAEIVSGEGVPFEISTLITKTSNDGLNTKWAADDQINLFHAEAGTTTYVNDKSFTVDEGLAGNFSGTLTSALTDGKSYDWYAFYPYSSYITTPANSTGYTYIGCRSDKSQSQIGNDSKAHLSGTACPLYGIAKDVAAADKPAIVMKNLASVVTIKVTNTLDEALTVSSVSFTSTENIVGQFGVDFSSDTPDYVDGTYASAAANLSVTNGTAIAKNASATFYIAIKPHTVKSGSNLVIAVNGIEKTLTLPKDVTFTAGSIKTIGYKYDSTSKSVTFDFTDPESLGLTKPGTSKSTNITASITKEDITLAATNGGTATRIYNKSGNCELRVYKNGGSLTFAAPDGYVVKSITFTGSTVKNFSVSTGKYTASSGIWVGQNQTVKFSASDTQNINTAIVVYEKGSAITSIGASDVTGVSARGADGATFTCTIENPISGTTMAVACDGKIVTEAIESDGTIMYNVAENTTGEAREGKITLTYGSVTKEVKVSQNADTFESTVTEIVLDATSGSQKTFTVTSDFDWTASYTGSGFKVSPAKYAWTEGGKQTVTVTATADNASESGTIGLGTLQFANGKTGKQITVAIKQKSSYVAPVTGTSVEFDYSKLYSSVTKTQDLDGSSDTVEDVTIAYDKVSGQNGPKYYANDTNLRIYNKSTLTITVPSGKVITAVDFSQGTTSWKNGKMAADHGTVSDTDKKWKYDSSKSSNKLVLTVTDTFKFTKIVVTYE